MNNLLTDAHRARIGSTPFKWCLQLERCLDICTPLIQQLVRRWDSCEESFRLWQHQLKEGDRVLFQVDHADADEFITVFVNKCLCDD